MPTQVYEMHEIYVFSINQKIIFIVSESIDKNIEIEIEKLFP